MKNVLITKMRQLFFVLIVFSFQLVHAQDASVQNDETPSEADIAPAEIVGDESRGVQTDTINSETIIELEELENRQASSFVQLLDSIPNVSLVNGSMPQGAALNIRGLGSSAGVYGYDSKVNFVIDGVASGAEEIYRNSGLLSLEPELFRQVKVSRGPSGGFKYSSGAMGATVETYIKDATDFLTEGDTFSFRQKFSFETNGNSILTSSILALAPKEGLDILLFYGLRESGDRTNGAGEKINYSGFELPGYATKVNYNVNDQSKLTFSFSEITIPERNVPYNVYSLSTAFGLVDRDTIDKTGYVEYSLNPLTTDLVDFDTKLSFKSENIDIRNGYYDSLNGNQLTETLAFTFTNRSYFETEGLFSHLLQTTVEFKERERSSIGSDGLNRGSAPGGTDRSFAFILSDDVEMFKAFTFNPQLRYENQTITSKGNNFYSRWRDTVADGTNYNYSALIGGTGVKYKFSDVFSISGSLFYNENFPEIDQIGKSLIFLSEKGVTHEVAIAYDNSEVLDSGDNELKCRLSLFHTKIYDSKENHSSSTNTISTTKVYLKGLEFELSYLNPNFYLDFNTGIVRGTEVESGNSSFFNNAPPTKFQLTLGRYFIDRQLNLMVEKKHVMAQDRTNTTVTGGATSPSDPYTTMSISSIYKPTSFGFKGFEFRLSVENLADTEYRAYLTDRLATGRNFKLSIAKTF